MRVLRCVSCLIAALASSLCGCATLSRGTTDEVFPSSRTRSGAQVTNVVRKSLHHTPARSPSPRDQVFSLTIAKGWLTRHRRWTS